MIKDAGTLKRISMVIPVYNEEGSLPSLSEKIIEVLSTLKAPYEILFIDDGSTDNSLSIIKNLRKDNPQIKLIEMRRNFGKSDALASGFNCVTGDIIITMDADLQDEPEEIPRFITKLEEGYDLVSGWKKNRKDPITKIISSRVFNSVVSLLSGVKIHDFNCGFKAYRREVVENLDVYGELHRFLPALAHQKGFRVDEIEVKHHRREFGESKYGKYGFRRFANFLLDPINVLLLTKYSKKPIHFFGVAGLFSFFIGFIFGSYLTILKIATGTFQGHYPLLIFVALLIIVGVQLVSLGLIGEMISQIIIKSGKDEGKIKNRFI
ncbi:MAG: glycosyltransferase family 2 protein [Chitinispirillia bacterium]|jgi:glycosyltransferase involved in cell wall biosynthesis